MANENLIGRFGIPGLEPVPGTNDATLDSVVLAAGSYEKGHALAQVAGTGTAVDQVYTFAATSPASGTFRLTVAGANGLEVTSALAYDAVAATVEAALEALPSVGTDNVAVTGGPLGSTLTVTFGGDLAGRPITMTAISSVANAGSDLLAITTTATAAGKPAAGYYAAYDDAVSAVNVAKKLLKYPCDVNTQGMVSTGPAEAGFTDSTAPAYTTGTFQTKNTYGLDANGITDLGKLLSGTSGTLTADGTVIRIGV